MKKIIGSLAVAISLVSGMACAEIQPTDISGVMQVHGMLNQQPVKMNCNISLSVNSVALTADQNIPQQGDKLATQQIKQVGVIVSAQPGDQCSQRLAQDQLALRLTGIGDNVENTVLANTLANGAVNVGVGIYSPQGEPIPLNSTIPVQVTNQATMGNAGIGLALVKLKNKSTNGGMVQSQLTIEAVRL
ncbi:fimbrial protein [Cronobacter dublinensis]